MNTIAYRLGWKQAQILHSRDSPELNGNLELYAKEHFSSLLNEGELKDCIQGMAEAISFLNKERKKQKEEEEKREKIIERLEYLKEKRSSRRGFLWFLLALHLHNDSAD